MITKEMTIADAIKNKPDIVSILSDTGIDFCCGGHRPLEEALNEKNLDISSYLRILNAHEKAEEKTLETALHLDKGELIEYIIDHHHKYELELLDKIDDYLKTLINVHYNTHGDELADIYGLFLKIKADLVPHFYEEEKKYFPPFAAGEDMDFAKLIDGHEDVGELLQELESMTNSYTAPEDGCKTYEYCFKLMEDLQNDIHKHIFLENSVLFIK